MGKFVSVRPQDAAKLPKLKQETFAYVPTEGDENEQESNSSDSDEFKTSRHSKSRRSSKFSQGYTSYGGTKDDKYYESKETENNKDKDRKFKLSLRLTFDQKSLIQFFATCRQYER